MINNYYELEQNSFKDYVKFLAWTFPLWIGLMVAIALEWGWV